MTVALRMSGSPKRIDEALAPARWWRRPLALHCGALLLFTALTLARLWPLVLHPASTVPNDLIDPVYNVWAIAIDDHNVSTWPEGIWSFVHGNSFYPTSHALSYGDVTIGLLPFNFPLHLLIPDPVVITNILVILSFVLSAYGAFLLGYYLTGGYAPALISGVAFAFSIMRVQEMAHLQELSTQWLIAAALCLAVAWRTERLRWWVAAGLLLGLSAVTELYYLAYLALPLLVVVCALGRTWTGRRLRGALVALGLSLALIVPFTIPYTMRDIAPALSPAILASYGWPYRLDLVSFLSTMPSTPIDSLLLPTVPLGRIEGHNPLFPGFALVLLVLVAWRHRRARLWSVFALASAVMALGPQLQVLGYVVHFPLPYELLLRYVPHFNAFRAPYRAAMGLSLGLAVLAAWGTRDLLALPGQGRRRTLLAIALVAAVAVETWFPVRMATLPPIPAGERWLATQPGIHAIAELPIANATALDTQHETEVMYDSTVHWKYLVNGAASVEPRHMARLRSVLATYPSPAALALLRQLRVDTVVLRLAWLPAHQRAQALAVCHALYKDAVEAICATS